MKLLAIDASTSSASIAILNDKQLISRTILEQRTQAQIMLPTIQDLCLEAQLDLKQLDGIVFGCGPGSFTGLRIACSIAKGLAYAYDLKLYPVSSLRSIAWKVHLIHPKLSIVAILDARMSEVYWSYYYPSMSNTVEQVNRLSDIILPNSESCVLAGVGIETYWDSISEAFKSQIAHTMECYPHAESMIELVQTGLIDSVTAKDAQPTYIRNHVTHTHQ